MIFDLRLGKSLKGLVDLKNVGLRYFHNLKKLNKYELEKHLSFCCG